MDSRYTETPQYPKEFKLKMKLKEEIDTATRQELTEWFLSELKDDDYSFDLANTLKYGIYRSSINENNKSLISSLETIKKKEEKEEEEEIDRIPSPPAMDILFEDNMNNKSATNIYNLSNRLISIICSYNDILSLLNFEKCNKKIYKISKEADSFHSEYLHILYSFELKDCIDLSSKSLLRFSKTKTISIDHFGKFDGNDESLWKIIIDQIFDNFTNLQTLIFGVDWIGIKYLTTKILKNDNKNNNNIKLKNITIKHAFQKQTKRKTIKKPQKDKQSGEEEKEKPILLWERTKKEEITEITIFQSELIYKLILSFKYLNNLTFDCLAFQPINLFNVLRNITIECIAFNDCWELGFFDNDKIIKPSIKYRKPLLCQSLIIRDIDHNSFDEFFDLEMSLYFWPKNLLKNLMIHWNINKRDYDSFITSNINKIKDEIKEKQIKLQIKNGINHNKNKDKKIKRYKKKNNKYYKNGINSINFDEKSISLLPNLCSVQTLYISIINGNGIKSLIQFLKCTKLTSSNLKMLVIRIPKTAAKQQITLNNDLSRFMDILNENGLNYLRFEFIEFSWISIWNTINVIIKHCGVTTTKTTIDSIDKNKNKNKKQKEIKKILKNLLSLEIHLYHPYTAMTTQSSSSQRKTNYGKKTNNDTKDLIIEIKNSISKLNNLDYLSIFINESNEIDKDIIKSFNDNGFKKDVNNLWFIRKKNNLIKRHTSYMDSYWEPVGIDPYA